MKLLYLCKRRPQGKDLLTRPYGRFYFLPKILAEKGHEIHILLFSHKSDPKQSNCKDGINWTSISLLKHSPLAYIREAEKIVKWIKPDWVCGFSDTYYGILSQKLGSKFQINSLIDAYDNYESYISWLKPLHYLWRQALSQASLVTAPGPSLADLLGKYRPGKPTAIIPMAADPNFRPLARQECRRKLGLPLKKKLIGYCGAISSSRDIKILFKAFKKLHIQEPNLELILTGRMDVGINVPPGARYLGYLPNQQVPLLLNSLDILVVPNRASAFGNYSHPVKLYEAMRCRCHVAVAETLSTKWIMRDHQDLLFEPNNVNQLCSVIKAITPGERKNYGEGLTWEQIGTNFEELLFRHIKSSK